MTVFFDLVVLVLAQLVLQDPDLGPQDLFLLLLSQLVPDLAFHLALIAQHIPLPGQEAVQLPQPHQRRQFFQNCLLIVIPQSRILGDKIRQIPRLLAVQHRGGDLLGHIACQMGIILEQAPGLPQQGLGFRTVAHGSGFLHHLHVALQIRLRLPQAAQPCPASALHHHPQGGFSQPQDLGHPGNGAHGVKVLLPRTVRVQFPLGHQKDLLTGFHGHFQGLDGNTALHVKCQVRMRENRQAP